MSRFGDPRDLDTYNDRFAEAEDEQRGEMQIRAGDWVSRPEMAGTAWGGGHVCRVEGGALYLGFGSREASRCWWLYGIGGPVDETEVGEVWRRNEIREWECVRVAR